MSPPKVKKKRTRVKKEERKNSNAFTDDNDDPSDNALIQDLTKKSVFSCCHCNTTFPNENAYVRHMRTCVKCLQPHQNLKCELCRRCFRFRNKFEKHMELWHSTAEGSVACEQCIAVCPSQEALHQHVAKEHEKKAGCRCDECGRTFTRLAHVLRHRAGSSCGGDQPSYPCDICGAAFRRKDNLIAHLRRQHILGKQFSCKKCSYSSHSFNRLTHHDYVAHNNERSVECDVCGATTRSRPALLKHMEVHAPEKPHRCDVCGYRAYMVEVLRRHVLTHVKERPHRCALCPASFIQNNQLQRHLASRHGTDYTCQVCRDTFTTSRQLRVHLRKLHNQLLPKFEPGDAEPFTTFTCEVCSLELSSAAGLHRHMQTHRLEPPRRCMYCVRARAFPGAKQLISHVRKLHPDVFHEHLAHVRLVLGVDSNASRVSSAELDAVLQILDAESERILREYSHRDVLYGGMAPDAGRPVLTAVPAPAISSQDVMSEEQLRDAVRSLLTKLVDEDALRCLGWPDQPVDTVLERVVEKCGGTVATSKVAGAARLREHAKQLLGGEGSAVAHMLRLRPVDHVISTILTTVDTAETADIADTEQEKPII